MAVKNWREKTFSRIKKITRFPCLILIILIYFSFHFFFFYYFFKIVIISCIYSHLLRVFHDIIYSVSSLNILTRGTAQFRKLVAVGLAGYDVDKASITVLPLSITVGLTWPQLFVESDYSFKVLVSDKYDAFGDGHLMWVTRTTKFRIFIHFFYFFVLFAIFYETFGKFLHFQNVYLPQMHRNGPDLQDHHEIERGGRFQS